jgi:hypothetical protein
MIARFIVMMVFQLAVIWIVGYFLSSQPNPMMWPVYGKLITLVFVIISLRSAIQES